MATLNASQVLILQTLAKFPDGLTRDKLAAKSGASCSTDNLGPQQLNGNHVTSLYGMGLVKPVKHEEEECLWLPTKKGMKAAATYKTLKPRSSEKVPASLLDPLAAALQAARTYSMEQWTDEDVKELREKLGQDWAELPLNDLRQQVVNRRKQGAFSSPTERLRKAVDKTIKDFGPEGHLAKVLTPKQVEQLQALVS